MGMITSFHMMARQPLTLHSFNVLENNQLLQWQNSVLEEVSGQVPKLVKDKDIAHLAEGIREEVARIQRKQQLDALSIDI